MYFNIKSYLKNNYNHAAKHIISKIAFSKCKIAATCSGMKENCGTFYFTI